MLDLKADVHLHEPEIAVRVAQEFKRARARIADGSDGVRHGGKERSARLAVDRRGRGFLEQLLVAALDGAVALAEADDMAFLVGEDLHLDVARGMDVFFKINGSVAEGGFTLGHGQRIGLKQLAPRMDDADAAAAAAGAGLEHDGIADGISFFGGLFGGGEHASARNRAERRFGKRLFRAGLIAQAGHAFGVRADEGDAVFPAGCGKLRIFGEEAVAGVDGLRAGEQRGGENALLAEVAVLRRGRTDADALVGEGDMQAVAVGLGVDGDGGNAHLLAGADDADGDLAAVRNQNFRKHSISPSVRRKIRL